MKLYFTDYHYIFTSKELLYNLGIKADKILNIKEFGGDAYTTSIDIITDNETHHFHTDTIIKTFNLKGNTERFSKHHGIDEWKEIEIMTRDYND